MSMNYPIKLIAQAFDLFFLSGTISAQFSGRVYIDLGGDLYSFSEAE